MKTTREERRAQIMSAVKGKAAEVAAQYHIDENTAEIVLLEGYIMAMDTAKGVVQEIAEANGVMLNAIDV